MNDVEKLIARLIDEHKITGEEAMILFHACRSDTKVQFNTTPTKSNTNVRFENGYWVRDLGNGISITQ
jgi:hypothetical protein